MTDNTQAAEDPRTSQRTETEIGGRNTVIKNNKKKAETAR